jgi:hypothetical protein
LEGWVLSLLAFEQRFADAELISNLEVKLATYKPKE